jgi:hypothetical protein
MDKYASAGMPAQLAMVGGSCQLPAVMGPADYQIDLEALATVAKLATNATVRVELVVDERQIAPLRVRDHDGVAAVRPLAPGESRGGMRLSGIRKRAELPGVAIGRTRSFRTWRDGRMHAASMALPAAWGARRNE